MLEVGTHAEVFRGLGLREPILSLNVVLLTLTGGECRAEERHRGGVAPVACDAHGAKISLKAVFLLSVEIDFERFHVFERAEGRLAALRLEGIVVVRDVADDVETPQLVGTPVEIGLIVEEVRFVLAVGLHRTEEILCRLIAQSVGPREVLTAQSHIGTGTKQRCRSRGLGMLGLAIGDVESRRHLVAVLCLEATCGEVDTLHHVGVDDRESFLLSAAYKKGPEDLHIIYIYRILVKGSATNIVLRRQFRVR